MVKISEQYVFLLTQLTNYNNNNSILHKPLTTVHAYVRTWEIKNQHKIISCSYPIKLNVRQGNSVICDSFMSFRHKIYIVVDVWCTNSVLNIIVHDMWMYVCITVYTSEDQGYGKYVSFCLPLKFKTHNKRGKK